MGSQDKGGVHNDDAEDDDVQIVKIVGDGNPSSDDSAKIQEFKHRNHSLGINASSVAACVGYHEFQSIPELMMKHVYQGQGGQKLLEHDAKLLGIEIVPQQAEEAELLELAESTGSQAALEAVSRALRVKHGEGSLKSVDEANALKDTVVSELAKVEPKRLTTHQLRILQEGTRQAVDTGCGHAWEEEALDRYQEHCGWDVRERNAECRLWHFEKVDANGANRGDSMTGNGENHVPSIRPIRPAYARCKTNHEIWMGENDNAANQDHRYDSRGVKRRLPSSYDSQISETAIANFSLPFAPDSGSDKSTADDTTDKETDNEMVLVEDVSRSESETSRAGDEDSRTPQNYSWPRDRISRVKNSSRRPFVTIKGMVDGIRDELGPTTSAQEGDETKDVKCGTNGNGDDDDDESFGSFSLTRVVVECKHRMRALRENGPRFSECIQAVVYCFMYEADDADIVQVLRSKPQTSNADSRGGKQEQHPGPTLTDYFKKPSPEDEHINTNANDGFKQDSNDGIDEVTDESNAKKVSSSTPAIASDGGKVTLNEVGAVKGTSKAVPGNENNGERITMKIAVDRVSLDDPQFGHRANWKSVILPKLRRWVDAVYTIRQSDDKRYRLLMATSMMAAEHPGSDEFEKAQSRRNHVQAAWGIVFEECGFLREGMSGERYRIEMQ